MLGHGKGKIKITSTYLLYSATISLPIKNESKMYQII